MPISRHPARDARENRNRKTNAIQSQDISLQKRRLADYTDPQGYYSMKLPTGYQTISKNFSGMRGMVFAYSETCNVTVSIKTNHPYWDPQLEMTAMVDTIQGGKMETFSGFSIDEYRLARLNEMDGYEILMSQKDQMAHLYVMDGRNAAYFYIAIVTAGKESEENHEILDQTIRESFTAL